MPPAWYSESKDITEFALHVADDVCVEEPQDYHGAMSSKESGQWDESCGEDVIH